MSQRDLAQVLKRSVSWVSQVERGELLIDSVLMLQKLAAAVGVSANEFTAIALNDEEERVRHRPFVEVLRTTLAGHPVPEALLGVDGDSDASAFDQADFVARTERAWVLVHASTYEELGPLLASLIIDLERGTRFGPEEERALAFELLADVYQVAAAMLMKVGDYGAGWIAADRAIGLGERCGDLRLALAGQYRMAHTLVGSDERPLALHVLRRAVRTTSTRRLDDPGLISLVGACALLLAVLEARSGNQNEAEANLTVARVLAARLDQDRDEYGTEFGPTNVAVHAVAIAVELGNAADALNLADAVDVDSLSPERQARFLVDVARAHGERRDVSAAVTALEQAERIAPEEIHELPLVRELLDDLEHYAGRRRLRGLTALRQRVTRN